MVAWMTSAASVASGAKELRVFQVVVSMLSVSESRAPVICLIVRYLLGFTNDLLAATAA